MENSEVWWVRTLSLSRRAHTSYQCWLLHPSRGLQYAWIRVLFLKFTIASKRVITTCQKHFPFRSLFCCGGHSGHIHELYLWKHSLTSEFPEITKHYGPMWWSEVRRERMLRNIKGKKAAFISSYPLDYSHTLIRTEGFFLLLGFGHGV